ncbi:flagellar protein FlaG [Desulfofundulus thermosubterraneus]|uniref:Flagellar protein FlaG n=1 Tax=Desulfofundulus thermosubterraneus DSM 16057 TaxID=1121432 RepID=A0A1M6K461_9FIRM|nr:flagellar protein FlaG [Desulfofundulus thermosubterraneus]SHJ53727.1 flagellar protein FlaG [Desulfofundulus thermosubterraneus DSM 16057]
MSKVEPAGRPDLSSMVKMSHTFKNDVPGAGEQRNKEALFVEEIGEDKRPTIQEVRDAVNRINETMELYRTELRFVLHEESGEIMVKVINAETQEVIREIPPEWTLKIVASVKRMLGLILDRFI